MHSQSGMAASKNRVFIKGEMTAGQSPPSTPRTSSRKRREGASGRDKSSVGRFRVNESPGLCDKPAGVTCPETATQHSGTRRIMTIVLGLESSCDDTAAAIVRDEGGRRDILSSVVYGQTELHADFGGVVPEIAARAHAEKIDHCVEEALSVAGTGLSDLDAIAVTSGPGLIGGVLSGVMCAQGIAAATGLPVLGINHLAGHALTPRLTDGVEFPYLVLLASGGHCQFLIVDTPNDFIRLGGTIDDAPGEAFDKTAKLLGLPQPGGPSVEAEAKRGDPARFDFPRPLLDRPGCDMSFSGLKTALLRARDAIFAEKGGLTVQDRSRSLRRISGGGRRCAVREVTAGPQRLRRERYTPAKFCGGRRGRSKYVDPHEARKAWRGTRRRLRRTACKTLHRQCGDDRVGGDREAEDRVERSR